MSRISSGNLKRRRPSQEPKRRFAIICEGVNTEPGYFRALKRAYGSTLIELEIVPGAGVPLSVATKAIEKKREYKGRPRKALNYFEENDEVWAVIDRDEHPQYDEAVRRCEAKGVRVARSNPCFEVWLILHVTNYDRPDGRHAAQAHLQKLRPEYDCSGSKLPDCSDMVTRVAEAEDRAVVQLRRREIEGSPFGPPSTTVGQLTCAIRDAARRAGRRK